MRYPSVLFMVVCLTALPLFAAKEKITIPIDEAFIDCEAKQVLQDLTEFVVQRDS